MFRKRKPLAMTKEEQEAIIREDQVQEILRQRRERNPGFFRLLFRFIGSLISFVFHLVVFAIALAGAIIAGTVFFGGLTYLFGG